MTTTGAATGTGEDSTPLLSGAVGFDNDVPHQSEPGFWKSASFIRGVDVAKRIAYYGISWKLMTYLRGPLGGAVMVLPLLGAFAADSYLSRQKKSFVSINSALDVASTDETIISTSTWEEDVQVEEFSASVLVQAGTSTGAPTVRT